MTGQSLAYFATGASTESTAGIGHGRFTCLVRIGRGLTRRIDARTVAIESLSGVTSLHCVKIVARFEPRIVWEVAIVSRSKNHPLPVEQRVPLVMSVLTGEATMAEAARRHGVAAETVNRWRNRFTEAGRAAMGGDLPGPDGPRASVVERRQRVEIEQLKLALAEATV